MHWRCFAIGLLGLAAPCRELAGQQPDAPKALECAVGVDGRKGDPNTYRFRGDNRCEGTYEQKVSGSSRLLIASVVESFEAIDDSSSAPLKVEWTVPAPLPVSLRAYSIRPGLFYRMDTARPSTTTSYAWPTDVIRALAITNADIGVVGGTVMQVGAQQRGVVLPLRISQRKPAARSARYRVTVWPSQELKDVFVTVALLGADGKPKTYVQRDENIAYGFYPAERGIEIPLKTLTTRGVYLVRIGATLAAGGSATEQFTLYHAGQ
jgi:hypothetical protein